VKARLQDACAESARCTHSALALVPPRAALQAQQDKKEMERRRSRRGVFTRAEGEEAIERGSKKQRS